MTRSIIRSRAGELKVTARGAPDSKPVQELGCDLLALSLPSLLTPKECAVYRRCSVRKLDRERAEGRGCPYVRIDGRILYRRADVDRFIESHLRLAGRANSTSEESAA
jgi:hypothetical protein